MSSPSVRAYGSYRQLVRAYPPGRRRDELLDTMLMAAGDAARVRPTGREVVDVLRHAPRAWLGRPASRSIVLVAVVVALMTGFLTMSLTGRMFGEADRPLAAITLVPLALSTFGQFVELVSQGFSADDGPFWSWTIVGQELFIYAVPAALAVIAAGIVLALCRPPRGASSASVAAGAQEPASPAAAARRTDTGHQAIAGAVALLMLAIGLLFVVTGIGGGEVVIVAGVLASVLVLLSRLRPGPSR